MSMRAIHQHPQDAREMVEGRALEPGEILQKDDMYSSSGGKWERIPEPFVGNSVQEGHGAMLVRPEQ